MAACKWVEQRNGAASSRWQDEAVKRGGPEFAWQSYLWTGTVQHVASVAAGFCTEAQLETAREGTRVMDQNRARPADVGASSDDWDCAIKVS